MNEYRIDYQHKRIVIWGVGAMQTDLEGLYEFDNVLYYIDDDIQDKNLITVDIDRIYNSKRLESENRDNLFIIICAEDSDSVVCKLNKMGYTRDYFCLAMQLLTCQDEYQRIHNSRIAIWGTGNTYSYYEKEINEYLPEVECFIVSELGQENFKGKKVFAADEILDNLKEKYIVVCSIYYKEIVKKLSLAGLKAGRDFIHIYSLVTLGNSFTRLESDYKFTNRSRGHEDLLVILSGYKPFVWESIFPRIKEYIPDNVDVCVVTSGRENDLLQQMCETNKWSYMSTSVNNVSLVINLAISLHPSAQYIYKIDEDIIVTKGIFEKMKNTYIRVSQDSDYEVGFVTPIIPVNGYGYVRALELFDAVEGWEERFGPAIFTDCYCHDRAIHDMPEAARYLWGENNPSMSNIDEMACRLSEMKFQYSICPIRYSIGFILFTRDNWYRMGMLPVLKHCNMGADEEYICKFCMMQARVMVVAENAIAGHISYTPQHKAMEDFYYKNKDKFLLKNN